MAGIIALLTDFGLDDIYVGVMQAVLLRHCPGARIINITHAIGPQNVREAAFALLNSSRHFAEGAVFCIVVDPGVGSERLPIAVKSERHYFVAPDNGVLSYALAQAGGEQRAVALQNRDYQADHVSHTFHGRDIFAPAAAHLARDPACFDELGPALDHIASLPRPELTWSRQRLSGEVMHIDRFGNIITSIGVFHWLDAATLSLAPIWNDAAPPLQLAAAEAHVTIHSHTVHGISHAYHEAPLGAILTQIDSSGFLEIGANQDNAADRLAMQVGDKVMLRFGR